VHPTDTKKWLQTYKQGNAYSSSKKKRVKYQRYSALVHNLALIGGYT
jgi:hypothetical protein